jgi:hypothetical protein
VTKYLPEAERVAAKAKDAVRKRQGGWLSQDDEEFIDHKATLTLIDVIKKITGDNPVRSFLDGGFRNFLEWAPQDTYKYSRRRRRERTSLHDADGDLAFDVPDPTSLREPLSELLDAVGEEHRELAMRFADGDAPEDVFTTDRRRRQWYRRVRPALLEAVADLYPERAAWAAKGGDQ